MFVILVVISTLFLIFFSRLLIRLYFFFFFFFFQAEDGIRDLYVTGVQTCALPISLLGGLGPPGRQRLVGRLDRAPGLLGPHPRHRAERLAGGGVGDRDRDRKSVV